MMSGAGSCFPSSVSQGLQMYNPAANEDEHHHHVVSSSLEANSGTSEAHSSSLLYSLSLLKDKVNQGQSVVSILISPDHRSQPESTSIAIASMGTMIQEIIVTASSMMFTCQQMAIGSNPHSSVNNNITADGLHHPRVKAHESDSHALSSSQPNFAGAGNRVTGNVGQERAQSFFSGETFDWYSTDNFNSCNASDNNNNNNINTRSMNVSNNNVRLERKELAQGVENLGEGLQGKSPKNYDIIEIDAADLLAKYTHYCQICGKGFKRDANLRMHMRAHGDEYKTSAALSNPMKNSAAAVASEKEPSLKLPRKYSCPHEGCRWNQKHAKFQPLKSMICVKNHYKRSHCPKMYVCKRCNRKQFSVLSDLRTHEKHCGDLKWQCSCGTTFSRKDKLMGHVALFVGHSPAINPVPKPAGQVQNQAAMQMQLDDRG